MVELGSGLPGLAPVGSPASRAGRTAARSASPRGVGDDGEPAAELPVAHVAVDTPLAHLDRPFDYLVPASMSDDVVPGSRVKVRFSGRVVNGFVLGRAASSEHTGKLMPLAKSVSSYPVLSPEVAALAQAVAERYAGTTADVLRLAVPPRHARVEAAAPPPAPPAPVPPPPAALATGARLVRHSEAVQDMAAGEQRPAGSTAPPGGAVVGGAGSVDGGSVDGGSVDEPWRRYLTGPGFVAALAAGRAPHAVWWALPGPDWPAAIASAVRGTLASGRGALVVVPDHRDADRVAAAISPHVEAETLVTLRADLGPAERYRRFLAVRSGRARVVVGTRAAIFAPVAALGLVVIWDDGDDLHAEPRAPYPHTRDVAALRARAERCAVLLGGFSPSAQAQAFVTAGWAGAIVAGRPTVRSAAPRVEAVGSDYEVARDPAARAARLPSLAIRAAREALAAGMPVLVQVPRRGYQPSLACGGCRRAARCRYCRGPLGRPGAAAIPACGWCGRLAVGGVGGGDTVGDTARVGAGVGGAGTVGVGGFGVGGFGVGSGGGGGVVPPRRGPVQPVASAWECPSCSGTTLRSSVVGDRRTAEELGRAFPGVVVRTSGRDDVVDRVPARPALVVATPGAEPVADGGYGVVLLLDGWALLGRPDLRAGEETVRRWCAAAALARPAAEGGRVVVHADGSLAPVQALVRWDPGGFVARESAERAELGFPPAVRMASVEGGVQAVADALAVLRLPDGADVLGPVPVEPLVRPGASQPAAVQSGAVQSGAVQSGAVRAGGGPAGGGRIGARPAGEPDGSLDEPRERALIRVPREQGAALAASLKAARSVLGTRKAQPVRVQLDPLSLL